ncbi:molecular chaperone DnaJ [uncultured Sneathiella sp.]|jgi:molecular chaperone DnaJ|uniref:molecular chaperone DnaJ n=1 Tax=uncultured Sneathiella sp. TaxID=879315 RepID=UPI0030D8C105|tara:strand:- start:2444 stop:3577 length:1134 start_codon:yes stop_codon:yes gene_type:complete
MAKIDYYEILEVERDVDATTLKSAYRKKAMQYHPDRNPGDAEAEASFKQVNEAYEILKDPQKRSAYDQYGHAAFENGGGPGGARGFGGMGGGFSDIFEDLFGDFMGGQQGGRTRAPRGSDLRYNLEISLEDAYHGKKMELKIPTTTPCESCEGTGAEAGSEPATCDSCQGLGKIRAQQGFFTIERTCPTCQGQGRVIKNPCKTCRGEGRVGLEKTLSVNIPAGVDDGNRIRLSGEGEAGMRGGAPGDLYIFLTVQDHRIFQRDGQNIHCRVPIPLTTAALGGDIEVPTLDGARAKVSITAGTQSGRKFRLRGKGMPVMNSHSHGDMYIHTIVETPVNLSKRQKELLKEFESEGKGAHSPESEGFFARVKDFLADLKD